MSVVDVGDDDEDEVAAATAEDGEEAARVEKDGEFRAARAGAATTGKTRRNMVWFFE